MTTSENNWTCKRKLCKCSSTLVEKSVDGRLCACRECRQLCSKCANDRYLTTSTLDFNRALVKQRLKYYDVNISYSAFSKKT